MNPRDPANYPKNDGVCEERNLRYRVWYQGKPRKIGDLSLEELRGALLDAQNDLNLACLKLYAAEWQLENGGDPETLGKVQNALAVATRHRVFSEEEEELDALEGGGS